MGKGTSLDRSCVYPVRLQVVSISGINLVIVSNCDLFSAPFYPFDLYNVYIFLIVTFCETG